MESPMRTLLAEAGLLMAATDTVESQTSSKGSVQKGLVRGDIRTDAKFLDAKFLDAILAERAELSMSRLVMMNGYGEEQRAIEVRAF